MPEAIVLINTNIGAEEEVMNELLRIEGISEAYIVYGVYDIVVKIKAPSTETLKEIISSKIRKISNVRSTLTMIVVEGREITPSYLKT
ncbi:MAG: Lrp/AsnC ligand binding domain-containing protein [Zestosphaera sp.]